MVTAKGTNKPFNIHRGMGLVSQVFLEKDLQQLRVGTRSIGHVRYSTTGSSTLKNAQPLVVDCGRAHRDRGSGGGGRRGHAPGNAAGCGERG